MSAESGQKDVADLNLSMASVSLGSASSTVATSETIAAVSGSKKTVRSEKTETVTVQTPQVPWMNISQDLHETVLAGLNGLCHKPSYLSQSGYRVEECTPEEIDGYSKCQNCGDRKRVLSRKEKPECYYHTFKPENKRQKQLFKYQSYPCCNRKKGCVVEPSHDYAPMEEYLANIWRSSKFTPSNDRGSVRAAVSVDCEMVQVANGTSEIVQVCAVDVLSGEVLVDKFVVPDQEVTDWRTPWSGMSKSRMRQMIGAGRTVNGWEEARKLLWSHINEDTILVGQALKHDLEVLRMVHTRVIDTALVSKDAVGQGCKDTWGLKRLCKQLFDREIQPAKTSHDCYEDTMAAREVVLFCVLHPDGLAEWANAQKEQVRKANAHRKWKRHDRAEKAAASASASVEE